MKKSSIFKNTIYKLVLELLRIIIPIVFIPYIYRILTPEIMGNIELSQSITNYFSIFAGFGVYTYGLREISRVRNDEENSNKLFSELFIISISSGFLITLIYLLYIFYNFNFDNILRNMLLINSIQLFSFIFYIEWINEAFENYKFISQKTIIIKIINLICIFLFVRKSTDYYNYLFLLGIFIFINNFISYIYIKRNIKFSFFNLNLKKYFIPLGTILLIANINILYTQLDKIALGFFSKKMQEVAYYAIAQKVMSVLIVIVMSIINVSLPRLSFFLGQGDQKNYEQTLNKVFPFIFMLLFPMGIGVIILSKEIALFFGGPGYIPAKLVLIIFGVRIMVVTIESILSNQVIFLYQKEKNMVFIIGICGLINFIMKYFLIKFNFFNAATAIFTTMLSEVLIIITDYWYIKKYLKLKLEILKLKNLKYLLISLFFFPISYFIKKLELNYIFTILIIVLICGMFYFILLFLSKDKQLNQIMDKIFLKNIKTD